MWSKNYLYFILFFGAVIVTTFLVTSKGDKGSLETLFSPSPTPTLPTATPESIPTPTISKPVKPTATIMIKEDNYESLALKFDEDGNRRLVLNEDCSALVPSQVAYRNNTEIMLDNTRSTKRHILKIGDREYFLEAGEWFLTTLFSPNLPVQLPIFCGYMELGQIDLI